MIYDTFFQLIQASLFSNEDVRLPDWNIIFAEMKEQAIAALPSEWLKTNLPTAKPWLNYCAQKQGQWVRVMHGQDQLIHLLDSHNIPCVIIKGAAAAMAYPHPSLRSMGDVDILVKRADLDKTAALMENNGYSLVEEKDAAVHHYNYSKDKISFELHKRLPVVDDEDEKLLTLFEEGIDRRIWQETGGYRFPVFQPALNGLVLIFHINHHLRDGVGLRQIIDWMMYVNSLTKDQWEELLPLLFSTGMERLALTVTAMCQKYLGLRTSVPGCDTVDENVRDELMDFIMAQGNFGRKAFEKDRTATFILHSNSIDGFFSRLQVGGLSHWRAAKKYPILRPFAWFYQLVRGIRILIKNKTSVSELTVQREKGIEQRKLIEALGLKVDKTIQYVNPDL